MSLISLLRKTCRTTLFTTPSHSQKFFIFSKLRNLYKLDISETDAHNPQEALLHAEKYASEVYGTKCTKFLTNGSSSGVIASVLACVKRGENVLIMEDAHPCHNNAVSLAGANALYYQTEYSLEWGVNLAVTADILEPYFKKCNISAVIITSPTYEGFVADVRSIKNLCEKYGAYLIVDEAHGALYPFSDRLPESAVNIADFVVQSLHKTAGGLNPTALLHTNTELDINSALSKINTTSPSYPLLASIEANIRFLNSKRGHKCINRLIDSIIELKKNCTKCDFGGDDITKILVKVNGLSGYDLSEMLYGDYGIEDEKTNPISSMLLCGIGTDSKKIHKLQRALLSIIKKCK